ncbi:hypothetical protein B0H19DRAFT_1061595 [Mycena capillaripes]|nr:hypothetical protein B0H19DRAFT_1061595 [Mycena capillaripes]
MEEQEEELDALVTSICQEKPSVRKDEEQWPVYPHIRRFMSARDAGLPKTRQSSQTSSTPSNSRKPCPVFNMRRSVLPSVAALLALRKGGTLPRIPLPANIVASPRAKREFLAGIAGFCNEGVAMLLIRVYRMRQGKELYNFDAAAHRSRSQAVGRRQVNTDVFKDAAESEGEEKDELRQELLEVVLRRGR